jgi:hypothetical protein
MAKEFFFIENPNDWPEKVVEMINKEEHDDLFQFSLKYLNSTAGLSIKNESEMSNILGPFNSTISARNELDTPREEDNFIDPKLSVVKQYDFIQFSQKAKRANILYERNYNKSVDLGVNIHLVPSMNEDTDD